MLEEALPDWRAKRRAAASADILEAAWELARENGLAGLSLRDLGRKLGMAAPSLYSYFDSKHALYDAMFADAWREVLAFEPAQPAPDLRAALRASIGRYMRFSLADPVRYQLMAQRPIPGFEPSRESYAVSQQAYAESFEVFESLVALEQEDRDLITAVTTGLINQQISNDPGGDRWVRLLDDAVDMLVYRITENHKRRKAPARSRRTKKGDK
ncbi:MAG: TetR/AcrR family transcriptional regulator [Mycobacteriales bacterium]|nr:TetR/AcrR family transcriptional regulator [Frankia sp.]